MILKQLTERRCEVENQYARAVNWKSNPRAMNVINRTMELRPYFEWRGLGFIRHRLHAGDAYRGARPLYLSAGFILEEGFEVATPRRIVESMKEAARAAGVEVVTGDTKVVEKGKGDGCYLNTAGIGVLEREVRLSAASACPGDVGIVSGPIGDHGITIMLARGQLELESAIRSDTAPLVEIIMRLLDSGAQVRCLRDATRGGVATVLNEIAGASRVAISLDERAIPLREEVAGACEILGIAPLHVACEGRFVAVVDKNTARVALDAIVSHPLGHGASIIGEVNAEAPGMVLLKTRFGGSRILDMLIGEPLPRICWA